jgi:DNA polymerase-1
MLVNGDVKGLEVVVAAELSDDAVLKKEINERVDIHETNRDRFGLGEGKSGRLIAKIFKFRLIYGGGAWAYANDPDFSSVGFSERQWQGVIDEYYAKYKGLGKWHLELPNIARNNGGQLFIPSGRHFDFSDYFKQWGKWPLTKLKNYPVQGFGADLVKLARIEFYNRLMELDIEAEFVGTIHDSLIADCPKKNVDVVAQLLQDSIAKIPNLCYNYYGYEFSLPMSSEITIGPNKKELTEWHKS